MFNVRNNLLLIALVALCALAVSCGKSAYNASGDSASAAQALYDEAEAAYSANDPDRAVELIDSLDRTFVAEVDLRRKAMPLRMKALDIIYGRDAMRYDSIYQAELAVKTSLEANFVTVSDPRLLESFSIDRTMGGMLTDGTAVQPRITQNGELVIASILTGHDTRYTSLVVSDGTEKVSTGAGVTHRFEGREMATFQGYECNKVVEFVANNATKPLTVTFTGARAFTMTMSENVKRAFERTYRYVTADTAAYHARGQMIYNRERQRINADQLHRISGE